MFLLDILSRCNNCPEFEIETHKAIIYDETSQVKVNIQITCAHRGLCDRLEQHLKKITCVDNVSSTTSS